MTLNDPEMNAQALTDMSSIRVELFRWVLAFSWPFGIEFPGV